MNSYKVCAFSDASDHFLVANKVRTRLCAYNNTCKSVQRIFDEQKLRSQKLPNRSPFAFRRCFSRSRRQYSGNTLPTPCTLLLGKRLHVIDSRSQHGSTKHVARQQLNDEYQATLKSAPTRVATRTATWSAFCNIGSLESMLSDWSLSLLCPVLKKGDATICSNYRGLSLLTIAYRILSSVLCERLKPFVNWLVLISVVVCPGKSTIDQIFTLRQILEKAQVKLIDTYHFFVDFKSAFDSPHSDHL